MSSAATREAIFSGDDASIRASVASETWEYADAETQSLTHSIHRYSGKFIPQIAARAIGLLTSPGEYVVDPYAGSGTTLLEAAQLGRRALGIDLSPLAVLIARTKVTPVPRERLDNLQLRLRQALEHLVDRDQLPLFRTAPTPSARTAEASNRRLTDPWFLKWFQLPVLRELATIDCAIAEVEDSQCRDIARVAFSDILRRSSNAHSGYPNVMFDRNASDRPSPTMPFLKGLKRTCELVARLDDLTVRLDRVEARHGTALALPLGDRSVDAVVSHPPYIGSIPYAEYGALSLMWLGADPKMLDRELTGGRRQSADVVERFRDGYRGMLREARRVLRPGRYVFLLVGNPVVKRALVDVAQMTIDLSNEVGLELSARAERRGTNRRANKMGAEHILILKRPASEKE
jgi:SAM-dependent methyltransferase